MDFIKESKWKEWQKAEGDPQEFNEEDMKATIRNTAVEREKPPHQFTVKELYETQVGWRDEEDPAKMDKAAFKEERNKLYDSD